MPIRKRNVKRSNWKTAVTEKRLTGRALITLRERILTRDEYLCVKCLLRGIYTPAVEVDHIKPLSSGGSNDDDNLQSLCVDCHKDKTKAENRRLSPSMTPSFIAKPSKPLIVIAGRPYSGQHQYIKDNAADTDMVIDCDMIIIWLFGVKIQAHDDRINDVVRERNRLLADFCSNKTHHERCFMIDSCNTFKKRKFWIDKGAEVVIMDSTADDCMQRLAASNLNPVDKLCIEKEIKAWR